MYGHQGAGSQEAEGGRNVSTKIGEIVGYEDTFIVTEFCDPASVLSASGNYDRMCLQVGDDLTLDRELAKKLRDMLSKWLGDEPKAEEVRLARALHLRLMHPDYQYETTKGPRKSWDDQDTPPDGGGWERNEDFCEEGWERFDFHEESYWRRRTEVSRGE